MILHCTHANGNKVVVNMKYVIFIRENEGDLATVRSIGLPTGNELYVTETMDQILAQIPEEWGKK